jgi:hypothetical protein
MAGPSLELEMRLKDQKVQVGMDALAAKEEKVANTLGKISKEAKLADTELNRFAKRTTEINTTPLEKYNRQLYVLEQTLARGKISQETYSRAVRKAGVDLDEARKKQQAALGGDAFGQIKSFAAGYLTLGAAVNVVASAFAHAREESKEALGSLRGLDAQRRKLVQMADSPEDLQGMLSRADNAAAASGVDRGTAYDALFQAKSFGFEKDYEKILAANEVIGVEASSKLAGKVSTMFGGKISGMESINMALAAGKPSEVDAESIAEALAMALEGGRRVGATPDETFAWTSTLSAAFKSPQVAADRIKAITNKAAGDPGLRSAGGLTEIMKRLQAMPEGDRAEILGKDQESNAAYEAMLEFYGKEQEIEQAVKAARLATGTGKDPLSLGMAYAGATTQTRSSLLARQGELDKQNAREEALASGEAGRQNIANRFSAASYRTGVGTMERLGLDQGANLASRLQLGEAGTAGMMAGGQTLMSAVGGGSDTSQFRLAQMLVSMFGQMAASQREQTSVMKDIRDKGGAGGVGRSVSAAALVPNN